MLPQHGLKVFWWVLNMGKAYSQGPKGTNAKFGWIPSEVHADYGVKGKDTRTS
jgi:hypothetical protein